MVFSKKAPGEARPSLRFPVLSKQIVRVQKKQQVGVILVTVLISGLAVYGAASLETDFTWPTLSTKTWPSWAFVMI